MGRGFVAYRPAREPDLATEAQVEAMNAKLKARVKQVNGRGSDSGSTSSLDSRVAQRIEQAQKTGDAVKSGEVTGSNPVSLAVPASNPLEAAQSPQAKSKLEWEKPVAGATGVKTKCGRYSCAKVTVDGKTFYELWKLAPMAGWFTLLRTRLDNFLQAQTLAQQDADKC